MSVQGQEKKIMEKPVITTRFSGTQHAEQALKRSGHAQRYQVYFISPYFLPIDQQTWGQPIPQTEEW